MAIACCLCGALTEPNATNTCVECVALSAKREAAATPLRGALNRCRECGRVQLRGGKRQWHAYGRDSPELLRLCEQSVDGLGRGSSLQLISAEFDEKNGGDGKLGELQLVLHLELPIGDFSVQVDRRAVVAVKDVECPECEPKARGWSWRAFVQLRYKSEYRRAFYRLEQGLLQNKAFADGFTAVKGGLDACFANKMAAERFVQLVAALSPVRIKTSSKTRSEDLSQHTANVQTTFCVEVCPIGKNDLVLLPKKLAQSLGAPRVAICSHTTGQLHFVDPMSGKRFELSRDRYWQTEFLPWETSASLVDFIVLDIDEPEHQDSRDNALGGARDVQVARVRDFGVNDATFMVRSHLADQLEVGDHVKGYDVASTNLRTRIAYSLDSADTPEVVLVRRTSSSGNAKGENGDEEPATPEPTDLERLVGSDDAGKRGKAEAREFDAFAADWADEQRYAAAL